MHTNPSAQRLALQSSYYSPRVVRASESINDFVSFWCSHGLARDVEGLYV